MTDWINSFEPYSLQHATCVGVCVVVMLGVAMLGRSLRLSRTGEKLRIGIGVFGILYWIGSNLWWNWPGNFELAESLPIHICDLAGLIGPIALLTRYRPMRAVLYFWGLVLSSQGFIQPGALDVGAGYVRFWLFWANHTIIVGTALYDVVALHFRPGWRDFLTATVAILLYLTLILPFDIFFDVNYGYVGNHQTAKKTIIDSLGPWPMRIVPLATIAIAGMALVMLPWHIARKQEKK